MTKTAQPETAKRDLVQPGRMEVITGPMFSGKSEELIRRLKRAQIARLRVASFKPDIDLRYQADAIASHSARRSPRRWRPSTW
jgi:thymidine kinase